MIRYERVMPDEELRLALNKLGADINPKHHVPLLESHLNAGLLALRMSPVDYGLLDLDDEQHLGLLYHWLVQVRTASAEPEGRVALFYEHEKRMAHIMRSSAEERLGSGGFRLAILGAGSAAAYYVNALGQGYNHRHTLLVGEPDPWEPSDHKRSRGKGYINHEAHLIGQWGKSVPAFSDTYHGRKEFADDNAAVLKRITDEGGTRIDGGVAKVTRDGEYWFGIQLANGRKLWAEKVVVATGAGPHARRGFDVAPMAVGQVMDLDEFMRAHPSNFTQKEGRSIVVHGPNAGIDAVERAGECQFTRIYWFMSRTSEPVFLSGNRLRFARYVPPTKLIEREEFAKLKPPPQKSIVMIDRQDEKIRVSYVTPEERREHVDVDLYVYALGQDATAPGAVRDILDAGIFSKLVPIYDIQGRHGTDSQDAIVGFQYEGSTSTFGVEVIGAAANMVSADKTIQAKLKRVALGQPGTVLTNDQLGTIKSAIGSMNSVMPRYVSKEVNFSTDDRTVLRTHIAVKYPNIKEEDAQRIIETILTSRRTTDDDMRQGYHPLGYTPWWQRYFRQMLEYWNEPHDRREAMERKHAQENLFEL